MAMVYQWTKGTHHRVDAQIVGEELERLRVRNNGRLENHHVVEAARPKSSPLHAEFEWNDAKAAEAWRLGQAGYIIRHIAVVIEKGEQESSPVRAFVSVQRDQDRSYTSILHALSDEDLRKQVLAAALSELAAWRNRYAELVELAQVFAAIDQAREGQ